MSMKHHGEGRGSGNHDPMGDGHDNFRYQGKAPMVGHEGNSGHPIYHKRARGGGLGEDKPAEEVYAGKGSRTIEEANRRKRGGKRAAGGPVVAAKPKVSMKPKVPALAVGGTPSRHVRMDRKGRKRGGSVGADSHPLTEASRITEEEGGKTRYSALDAEDD